MIRQAVVSKTGHANSIRKWACKCYSKVGLQILSILGTSLAILTIVAHWGLLGALGALLGRSWGALGALLGRSWASFEHLSFSSSYWILGGGQFPVTGRFFLGVKPPIWGAKLAVLGVKLAFPGPKIGRLGKQKPRFLRFTCLFLSSQDANALL